MHIFLKIVNESVQSSMFLNFLLFSSHILFLQKKKDDSHTWNICFDIQLAIAAMKRYFWDSDCSRFTLKTKNLITNDARFGMNNSAKFFICVLREKPGNLRDDICRCYVAQWISKFFRLYNKPEKWFWIFKSIIGLTLILSDSYSVFEKSFLQKNHFLWRKIWRNKILLWLWSQHAASSK